jgi:peptide/nickel transport system permease protein
MSAKTQGVLVAIVLISLHMPVLFAGFFAPYPYAQQNRDLPFAPPTRLRFADPAGALHFRPFVYAWKQSSVDGTYEEDRTRVYPVRLFISEGEGQESHLFGVAAPARIFLFGSDGFGRDQLSRMLYGGRISLLAGFLGAAIALLTGTVLGTISGYCGKSIDAFVMRLVELFMALPWLYLLFAVRAVLPLRVETTDAFLLLIAIIGVVGWARPARMVRGIVLSAKEHNFVTAARAMGASHLHILRWHVLPQTYHVLLTMAALLLPQFILAEVTLSFLGLGVGEPVPSWGNLLAELQKYNVLVSYWWMYLPAVALIVLFLAYTWVSDRLQKKFDMVVL